MVDAGLIVLASFISPFRAERRHRPGAASATGEFIEVFVDTPLAVAEARDPKGLFPRRGAGSSPISPGSTLPTSLPTIPSMRIDTTQTAPEAAAVPSSRSCTSSGTPSPSPGRIADDSGDRGRPPARRTPRETAMV